MKWTLSLPICSIFALRALAAPSPNSSPSKGVPEVINFDERPANPLVPALNVVGVEKDLFFNSWAIVNTSLQLTKSPHSPPNVIVTAFEQQKLTGTPYITTIFSGHKYQTFDLKDFWFLCNGNTGANAATVALQCTIDVAGFRGNQEVASATFTFTPTVLDVVTASMIHAVFDDKFKGLQNVTIVQDDPTTKALAVDDISVVLYP